MDLNSLTLQARRRPRRRVPTVLRSGPITRRQCRLNALYCPRRSDVDDAHVRRVDQHDLVLNQLYFSARASGACDNAATGR